MAVSQHSLETGMSFGRYRVASQLAVGGMATVWLARLSGAQGFEKEVVIKTMLAELSASSEMAWMFVNEASIAARLNHPNIVQVFDFGCMAGHHYIVMEHVAGQSLRQIQRGLRTTGELFPHRLLLSAIADVCSALGYAHDLSDSSGWLEFVHGDISPENVMVSHGDAAKLIDFGAAHIKSSPRLSGKFIGKYRYTSPECLTGAGGDRRSDIYSLGVMLYELLTGVRPYEGTDGEIIAQVRRGRPRHPLELAPDLPPDLVEMTLTAMALDPADRYQTVEQLADDIAQFLLDQAGVPALMNNGGSAPFSASLARRRFEAEGASMDADGGGLSVEIHIEDATLVEEPGTASGTVPGTVPGTVQSPLLHSVPPGVLFELPDPSGGSTDSTGHEAARHFDRGFALVAAKRYQEALQEWELALAGDPGNRIYQMNIRRLREHVEPTALDDRRR